MPLFTKSRILHLSCCTAAELILTCYGSVSPTPSETPEEHGIGGSGEFCSDNDAHLGRINVLYHEALDGKYVPRAVLFDLEPGVIDAVRASPLGESFRQEKLVNQNAGAGKNWAKAFYKKAGREFC